MNIQPKPNYYKMKSIPYLELVFEAIEHRFNYECDVVFAGYDPKILSRLINDACERFRPLNCSPAFTANQIIKLIHEYDTLVTKQ